MFMSTTNVLSLKTLVLTTSIGLMVHFATKTNYLEASSHREAPLIANDPLADNTDVYAFRSPDNPNTVTIIANYVPLQLPSGGPNYASFGENIRYEVHVKNSTATNGDDLTYRFTFKQVMEDSSTFFNIRLGKQNLKTSYVCEKSIRGGAFTTVVAAGVVPPNNIGPRSIEGLVGLGLGNYYVDLMNRAITTASTGEKVFCGPVDDPFFVDLGGIFDLGGVRSGNGALDAAACKNVHSISLQIPISMLQKDGKNVSQAANILDGDFVIGVWASASRQQVSTLSLTGGKPTTSGQWVQVSRLGMPLTNEVVIPIGSKDKWNSLTPYNEDAAMNKYFTNPELGLYMDDAQFGVNVQGFYKLRIQRGSQTVLGAVDFGNGRDGLSVLRGHPATRGTALDTAIFGNILLQRANPRSVDLLPIFYTGVPNLAPYQLATGKTPGNPLTAGKPFINNFLPTLGDMLRLNMAVPVTQRNDPKFSSEGIINAAVLGLTDPTYANTNLQFIPNMDGFPNGRRLEDDVTRIELQAVGGVALAAIGLWYDDWAPGLSPLTPKLLNVLGFTTGVEKNDKPFQTGFPYQAMPHIGTGTCGGYTPPSLVSNGQPQYNIGVAANSGIGLSAPVAIMSQNYPNPFIANTTLKYHLAEAGHITISVYDAAGRFVYSALDGEREAGDYEQNIKMNNQTAGLYFATMTLDGKPVQTVKMNLTK
jgi:hypothetical protein